MIPQRKRKTISPRQDSARESTPHVPSATIREGGHVACKSGTGNKKRRFVGN